MSYLEDVRRACIDRFPGLLMEWLPGGVVIGHTYQCSDLNGGPGDSLKVTLSGRWAGRWKDWATGEGGDSIDLYARLHWPGNDKRYSNALHELGDQFGIARPVHQPKGEWQPITPVPESGYQTDPLGNPKLPNMKWNELSPSAFWPYFDADGRLLNFRCRFDQADGKKDVIPLSFGRNKMTGEMSWKWKDLPKPRPLFNLMGLGMNPSRVLVVEGEKCAKSAQDRLPGWCVITWPGGSKSVDKADWSPLAGFKGELVLWPDKDSGGEVAMARLGRLIVRSHRVIKPLAEWPEKTDVADLNWNTQELEEFLKGPSAPEINPFAEPSRPLVEIVGSDRLKHIERIYDTLRAMDANLFWTPKGICEVRIDTESRPSVRYLDAGGFRDWAAIHLDTRRYTDNELRWTELNINLASAVVFDASRHLRRLRAVVEYPLLTPSGQMIERSGYNEEVQAYIALPPNYSPCRSKADAIEIVKDRLADFPFERNSDRSQAVAFVLTCLCRHAIKGPTPLHRFEAPVINTGKSKLLKTLCYTVTSEPKIVPPFEDEDRERDAITAAIFEMSPIFAIDNAKTLKGNTISELLTAETWSQRILYQQHMATFPIYTAWAASMNNPQLTWEILRRTIPVRINARMENPGERLLSSFRHKYPEDDAKRDRAKLTLPAFAALCRLENTKNNEFPTLSSFESWSRIVGTRLEEAGFLGFLKDIKRDSKESTLGSDEATANLVQMWGEQYGTNQVSSVALIEIAQGFSDLPVERTRDGKITPQALGWFIRSLRDRVFGDFVVLPGEHTRKGMMYSLFSTKNDSDENKGLTF